MNRLCVTGLFSWVIIFNSRLATAQEKPQPEISGVVEAFHIAISYNKTTNLIFPYSVISVDRGNANVLVQKAKAVENVLQLKAARKRFVPTNLSVVTSDGKFYSFLLSYEDDPEVLSLHIGVKPVAQINSRFKNEQELATEAYAVKVQPLQKVKETSRSGLDMTLAGTFVSKKNLWFKFHITNSSPIEFRPSSIRFFLRDRKRTKRTAIQETEQAVIYANIPEVIHHNTGQQVIAALSQFFIPKEKYLVIQIGEENNGRAISMKLKQKVLLKGVRLPE